MELQALGKREGLSKAQVSWRLFSGRPTGARLELEFAQLHVAGQQATRRVPQ